MEASQLGERRFEAPQENAVTIVAPTMTDLGLQRLVENHRPVSGDTTMKMAS